MSCFAFLAPRSDGVKTASLVARCMLRFGPGDVTADCLPTYSRCTVYGIRFDFSKDPQHAQGVCNFPNIIYSLPEKTTLPSPLPTPPVPRSGMRRHRSWSSTRLRCSQTSLLFWLPWRILLACPNTVSSTILRANTGAVTYIHRAKATTTSVLVEGLPNELRDPETCEQNLCAAPRARDVWR